ncbi:HK97 gp10 family phage protein [Clostridium diolis]|uniref:HK97 gp10 family phage protein n=1 Tax=Clostridium diolis TaxID=223919 RepID=UPI003AF73A8E
MNSFEDLIAEAQKAAEKIDNIISDEMEIKATECVASIQAVTPVKTGILRRSMTHGKIIKMPNSWTIKIGSSIEYAQAVEDGHKQEVGRYVPAIGKKLVKEFVPGKHMIRDNVDIYQDILTSSINERIEREV